MKSSITFTYSDAEKDRLNRVINADNAYSSIYEILDYLRSQIKYNDNLSGVEKDILDVARDRVYEILEDNYINLDRDYP